MPFVVVYDAGVLYPSVLRDLLIRLAQSGLCQARWTDQILDEVFDSLQSRRPDLDHVALKRTPPGRIEDVLVRLERSGLLESVAALRAT